MPEKEKSGALTPEESTSTSEIIPHETPWGKCARWWPAVLRDADARSAALSVAIVLATYADNDTGEAWPAEATIGKDARLSVRQVRRAIAELIRCGIVTQRRRRRSSAVYTVLFERPLDDRSCASQDRTQGDRSSDQERTSDDLSKPSKSGHIQFLTGHNRTQDRPIDVHLTDHKEQTTQNDDDDDDGKKPELVDRLVARGISRRPARAAALTYPQNAGAWLAVDDWRRELPATVRNVIGYVTAALGNGEPPPARSAEPDYLRSLRDRSAPRADVDLRLRVVGE